MAMTSDIMLREVTADDLPIFFEQQRDPEANHMAAFTARNPNDRDAFVTHWAKIQADPTTTNRTIVADGQVAGNIASFIAGGKPEVCYWLGKSFWGQGIATQALRAFLSIIIERPLYAAVAKDNNGSLHVLEKCGFVIIGEGRGFANARGAEIEEYHLKLDI